MNRTKLRVLGILVVAFLVGLAAGCQDDGASLTGASSMTENGSRLSTTSPIQSNSGEGSAEDEGDDDGSDDDTSDDDSDDASDDESDDDSADDESDDDSADDDEGDDDADAEVRGLFFGTELCPVAVADCVLALRIKDTLVAVTNGTEISNEPAGEASVSPADLAALVSPHPGLPMRAEGTSESGVLVAQRLRIDDEIRATGQVAPGAPGCGFGLTVQSLTLCFALSPGMTAPNPPGSTVRVEGLVPADFVLPFVATHIERSDD